MSLERFNNEQSKREQSEQEQQTSITIPPVPTAPPPLLTEVIDDSPFVPPTPFNTAAATVQTLLSGGAEDEVSDHDPVPVLPERILKDSSDVDVITESDHTVEINNGGEDYFQFSKVQFSLGQRIVQEWIQLEAALTTSIFFSHVLPPVPAPVNHMIETAAVYFNGQVNNVLATLTTKERPYIKKGFLTDVTRKAVTFGLLLGAGYGLASALVEFTPELTLSDNPAAKLLTEDAFRAPLMGVCGYWLGKLVHNGILGAFNYCNPAQDEELFNEYPQCTLIQKAGDYLLRWFGAVTTTQAILDLLKQAGQTAGHDPRTQLGVLLFGDACKQLAKQFAFNPHPLDSLVLKRRVPATRSYPSHDNEVELPSVASTSVTNKEIVREAGRQTLENIGFGVLTYVISELTFVIADAYHPKLFNGDNLAKRVSHYGITFGGALGVKFLVQEVGPKVVEAVSNYCCSFFKKPTPANRREVQPLLIDELNQHQKFQRK
ncbi:MAG: hypothetical protein JO149_00100 [Gammaproteobacteria bacterium]|nr:hypothetical protein [Gammaproteobacteria bacterium]